MKKNTKYICSKCGCDKVVAPAWVNLNTLEFVEWYEPTTTKEWCDECMEFIDIKEIEYETN